MQRFIGTKSDDRIVRAGHPNVGLKRGAIREDALIRGRYMRVSAKDGGDAAVEVAAHRLLLR